MNFNQVLGFLTVLLCFSLGFSQYQDPSYQIQNEKTLSQKAPEIYQPEEFLQQQQQKLPQEHQLLKQQQLPQKLLQQILQQDLQLQQQIQQKVGKLISLQSPRQDYHLWLGHSFYKFHMNVTHWADARQQCHKEGGRLITIDSAYEDQYIHSIWSIYKNCFGEIDAIKQSTYFGYIYVGYHDYFQDGYFVSVSGKDLYDSYYRWGYGQPNNRGVDHCTAISNVNFGGLNDLNCAALQPFICEIDTREQCNNYRNDVHPPFGSPSQHRSRELNNDDNHNEEHVDDNVLAKSDEESKNKDGGNVDNSLINVNTTSK
ncbi:uncharacterized protein LOC123298431 [Chrysoperla carnea]|uniref:uncharacterized protein LOC123298431 n=1 Tax=Chrysoperla carnea TaxID=189513 RepID=UPI001D083F8F|nr:uncharacterized protein LOC123298431 [Chrysoperla carnea]